MSSSYGAQLQSFRIATAAAIEFLTRVSIPSMRSLSPSDYGKAQREGVVYFPLVGALVGGVTATIFLIATTGLSPWIAALIAIGFEALLTGAFHEDALADTCDALGGGWTREQVLAIMKDSRLGTYGTLGLVLGVGLRVACTVELASIGSAWAFASIIAAASLGRLAIVALMVTTPPVVDRVSQAREMSSEQTLASLKFAALVSLACCSIWWLMHPLQSLVTCVVSVAIFAAYRRTIIRRVAGTTGDLLGCSAFMVQAVVLAGSCWGGPVA